LRKNSWLWMWKLYAGRQQVRYPRGVARTLFDIPEGIGDISEQNPAIPEGLLRHPRGKPCYPRGIT
jgi:hypothetical protein